jgi:hypothetical protein
MLKILKMTPLRSSAHYFRLTALDRSTACDMPSLRRSRLLEQLLARADSGATTADWRADAFQIIASPSIPMPGVAAAALFADQGMAEGRSVLLATPVHYLAEIDNVRVPADGILSLHAAEADALAGDFNRVWHDAGIRLLRGRGAALYCVADEPLQAATHDPRSILDSHIENHLPAGPAGPRLRRLMSEIEMWLFEHAVNRRRSADGAPTLSGLWLWGCGPIVASLPPLSGWSAGSDPLFGALGLRAKRGPDTGVAVISAEPGAAEWGEVESHWLEPSLKDLRAGRIGHLMLSAGERRFSISGPGSRRFWRPRRPWWEFFA